MPRPAAGTPSARDRLLTAALSVIRAKGYSATTVDDLCAEAGVTKGAFFHHFKSKDAIGVAAADHWSETTGGLFASADYHDHADPLDRVLAYVAFRRELIRGALPDFTCLVGTMVQEAYEAHPDIAAACGRSIFGHAETLEGDIAEAMSQRGMVQQGWSAASLARHTQAVLQGAFILAKAGGDPALAIEQIDHLHRYIALLFQAPIQEETRT